jgi:hypothetical protein
MIRKPRPEPVIQSSLGLSTLCQRLDDVANWNILELGPVRGVNIEFWSRFSESIYVAGLHPNILLPQPEDEQEPPEPEWDRLLGLPKGRRFDVILAWDLLNYFELTTVASLIRYLSRFCRPEAVIFALIFDLQKMPEELTVYRIVDESHLSYEYRSSNMRTCPRHQPRALTSVMRQFQPAHSFRLRNGVIEFLFVFEGDKTA